LFKDKRELTHEIFQKIRWNRR